jgi:hypothetical protein
MQRCEIVHTVHTEPIVPGRSLFHFHASVPRSHQRAVVLLYGWEHGGRALPLHLSLAPKHHTNGFTGVASIKLTILGNHTYPRIRRRRVVLGQVYG